MSKKETVIKKDETTAEVKTSTSEDTSDSTKSNQTTQAQDSSSDEPIKGGIAGEDEEVPAQPAAGEETEETPAEETVSQIEPYELELSEESPISDAEFEEIVEFAERMKLSKQEAENLIKMRENSYEAAFSHVEQLKETRRNEMVNAFKNTAELHTPENKNYMKQALKAFGGDPEFIELFKDPEMNYNVQLAKFLVNVGKKILATDTDLGKGKSAPMDSKSESGTSQVASKFYKGM